MRTLLFLVSFAIVGLLAALNHLTAANLRAELDTRSRGKAELNRAQHEHERLRQLHASATQRATQPRPAAPAVRAAPRTATDVRTALIVGEWHPPASWKNRGDATPTATIETALWAAAGGDLAALQHLLHLDDTLRTKAESLRARLPEAARGAYPSAEHLLAAFATKSLPLGDAQLVWNHQPGADEAYACLFVKNPDHVPAPPSAVSAPEEKNARPETRAEAIARAIALKEARAKEKRPPMAPRNDASRALYVVLRRTDTGWKIVASPGAVDRIAQELGGQGN